MKLLASLLSIVIASPAVADGMMLRVGPVPGVPDLPYQRAVVSYRDGVETLIVDSRLGGGEKGDHVWVLPLPGAPTTIEPVETSYLDAVFAAGAPMIQGSAKARADEVVYTPRARAWLPWILLATIAAGGMAAGFAFLTAPVLDEATGRLLGHG